MAFAPRKFINAQIAGRRECLLFIKGQPVAGDFLGRHAFKALAHKAGTDEPRLGDMVHRLLIRLFADRFAQADRCAFSESTGPLGFRKAFVAYTTGEAPHVYNQFYRMLSRGNILFLSGSGIMNIDTQTLIQGISSVTRLVDFLPSSTKDPRVLSPVFPDFPPSWTETRRNELLRLSFFWHTI
jgi:hypothetical protein